MNVRTILPKILMALTGLAWFGFLVGHLSGNFLLFAGPEKFDAYAHYLESTGGLLILAEVLLIVFLATHVFSAFRLAGTNTSARREAYAVKRNRRATFSSRTMLVGGIVLLLFIVTHVYMFKFGATTEAAGEPRALHELVMTQFQNPLVVTWYVLAMLALGLHLSHGFGSAFQTLGIFKPAWRAVFKNAGLAFGWLIAVGFISMPVWAFLKPMIDGEQ